MIKDVEINGNGGEGYKDYDQPVLATKAHIGIDNGVSEEIEIAKGVKQGCILLPLTFNLYSEKINAVALDSFEKGITINMVTINNLCYADDTVIMASSAEGLQPLLESIVDSYAQYSLTLNINKIKCMLVSKQQHPNAAILMNKVQLEKVDRITYLGSVIKSEWDNLVEIKHRIECAIAAF